MRTLVLALTFFLATGAARADLLVIDPGKLTYTLAEDGARSWDPANDCALVKQGTGYMAKKIGDARQMCNVDFLGFGVKLTLNGYTFNHRLYLMLGLGQISFPYGEISAADYTAALNTTPFDELIGNERVFDENDASSWLSKVTVGDLYDVQRATVYTKDGSCYAHQLRLEVDTATKEIIDGSLVDVAAHCP